MRSATVWATLQPFSKKSKICRRLKFTGIQIASGLALVFDVLKIIIATSERNSAECRPSDYILVKES